MRFKAELSRLQKRARKGYRGFPYGTVLFYGPDDATATKAVASVIFEEDGEAEHLRRWYDNAGDMIRNHKLHAEILAHLEAHGARTIAMLSEVNGCPHEEGLDYPDGEDCPQCPFWAGRERPMFRNLPPT